MATRFFTLTAPLDATVPNAPLLTALIAPLIDASPDAGFEVLIDEVVPAESGADGAALLARALAAQDWLAVDADALRLLSGAIAQPVDVSLRAASGAVELVIEDGDTLTLRAVSAAPVAAVTALLAGGVD